VPRRRAVAAGCAALVLLLAVAWCSVGTEPDASDDRATAIDDTEGEGVEAECAVTDAGNAMVLHPGAFTATQRTRIVSVSLDGAENLDVVEEVVVDYRGPEDLQGFVVEYPPRTTSFIAGLTDWDTRVPLVGAVLGPRDGRQAVLIAVRLADPDQPGHVRGVTIETRTAAGPRTLGWEQLVLVLPHRDACTSEVVAGTTEWTG
jgi:hypothetical protein